MHAGRLSAFPLKINCVAHVKLLGDEKFKGRSDKISTDIITPTPYDIFYGKPEGTNQKDNVSIGMYRYR